MKLPDVIAGGLLVALGVWLAQRGSDPFIPPTGSDSSTQISPDNWWVEGDHKIGFQRE